jgi:predicted nucleotidyltransferase
MDQVVAPIEDAEIRRVVETIVAGFAPSRIILFGSHARGDAGPDSDLDVLVVMPDGTPRLRTGQAIYQVLSKLRGRTRGVDVVVTTETAFTNGAADPGTVISAAHREGRLLYGIGAVPVV